MHCSSATAQFVHLSDLIPFLPYRYEGEFRDGQRHGYGALYYATGASYEGEWQLEQKHGRGVFTFEDGTVFDGMFADDQAVLSEGQAWGPVGAGIKLRVHDLLEDSNSHQVCCVTVPHCIVADSHKLSHACRTWPRMR